MRAVDIDELERAAAEIADHAVGLVHAGNDAERRQLRLARAREHVDLGADDRFGELDEGRAVLGVAAGGRRDREHALCAHGRAQRTVALERPERLLHRVGGQAARSFAPRGRGRTEPFR